MTYKYYPKSATNTIGFLTILPDNYDAEKEYAAIFFWHGMGNRGSGTQAELENLVLGAWSDDKTWRFPAPVHKDMQAAVDKYSIIVLAAQTADDWQLTHLDYLGGWALKNLSINWTRIMMAGFSMGAGAALALTGLSKGQRIRCIVALGHNGRATNWQNIVDGKTAVLACCNNGDSTTPKMHTENAVKAINALNPQVRAVAIIYPENGHGGEDKTFGLVPVPGSDKNIYEWLLSGQDVVAEAFPLVAASTQAKAVAGADISTQSGIIKLDGRGSINYGDGLNGTWHCISAPEGVDKSALYGGYIVTDIRLPKTGTYVFELRLKQGPTDQVNVMYTAAPSTEKQLISIDQINHRLRFSDGSEEFAIVQVYDIATKKTTFKTAAGKEYVI